MQRTKILYLVTKATWGGAQRYVYDLATSVPQNEFEASVAYGTPGMLSLKLPATAVASHELASLGRDVALLSDIRGFLAILAMLRAQQPDIVHLNSSKAAALGALAARIAGIKKIIFTVHGWPFKESRNGLWRAFVRTASWLTAVLSHTVIVVSEHDIRIASRMPFIGRKTIHIPIGLGPQNFLLRDEAASALRISGDATRFVTVAELTANKGLRYALDALRILDRQGVHADYYLIGDGEQRGELAAHAAALGLAERVRFLGYVDGAARYLKAFDVFVLPSVKEGMPYVLLEAAACGLPIVTTTAVDVNVPGARRVPPADAAALASALAEHSHVAGLGSNPYPLSAMVERTLSLYR